jgi:carbon-monoxide dehydrogenase medium subunit
MVAASARGERAISADDFFAGMLTTALEPDEILREVRIPIPQGKFGQAYMKVHHPASGFAVVGVAVTLSFDQGGVCSSAGIGLTGVSSKAYRASGVEGQLVGKKPDDQLIASAASRAAEGVDVNGDLYASAEYRRHLAEVYARRAIKEAISRAG